MSVVRDRNGESDAQDDESDAQRGATCVAPSCWDDARPRRVDGREAVLCDTHAKAFLGVSS
ncbi:hypothetical protein [Halorubrum ezzemoulense]|uniref:Uncharacterized protein n=1 Tax=Halorubrum ezzemoulense TaxID=337243 RepID=A0A256JX41_HALEZ|nr:hypothetical protein [Halorubrum ezzemoulense]OYR73193.1 hypothetical protein DJ76_10350 [Halorubrum ezzemoulense]